jgi:hypothetical protein
VGKFSSAASPPMTVSVERPQGDFYRADLELHGVDHSKASYEGRVFLNNPGASVETPRDDAHGYAGSFYIFGHGGCAGDEGHCVVPEEQRPFDLRREHQLTTVSKRIVITEPLRRALQAGSSALQVTIVPVVAAEDADIYSDALLSNLLMVERVSLNTYA